ncbi:MAG: hypothetical protein OIN86_10105 [Candidatus Methanoperedens sp.]|nr:hypothetical protein [Candidatus Methanoperedens sp.]CAG0982859.1 hypothetical protein METP1_01869 [Methanosarcinales archaeon]
MVKKDLEEFNKAVEKAVENVVSISKSGKPDDIAGIIISSYNKFGDNFLNLVKKKKVLFSIHSIDRMELIFKIIFNRLNQTNSKIPNDKYNNLKHFLHEHRLLNVSKNIIRNSLDKNPCWEISRDLALMEIAAEIYEQLIYTNKNIEKLDKNQASLTNVQNLQGGIRSLHEDGTIVLKEALQRNLSESIIQVEECHWNQILNLADRMALLQIIEDRYTYFDWSLLIDFTNEFKMVVCRPKSFELESALHFSDYRSASLDLAKYNSTNLDNEISESDIAKNVFESIKIDGQIDFNLLLQKMNPEIEKYVQTHINRMREIIEESHLIIIQKSPEFNSDLFPIISAYKCLLRLCILRKLALDELLKETSLCHGLLMFVLTKEELCQYFQKFGELDIKSAKFASDLLIFKPDIDSVRTYDPYQQPLILLDNNEILVLETYIQNSRLLRNSLKLLTKRNIAKLHNCGYSLETRFQKILQINQFKTNEGKKITIFNPTGKLKTDLDVLAYREGVLFLGQVKTVLPPGNLYEIYRLLETLKNAADQLHLCVENLDVNMDKIKHLLGITKDKAFNIEKVVACILTNDITFEGYKIDEFIVFDIDGFDEILKNVGLDKPYPEALILEFERYWEFHKKFYEDRMMYYEVKFDDIIFLCPGLPLVPITNYSNTGA